MTGKVCRKSVQQTERKNKSSRKAEFILINGFSRFLSAVAIDRRGLSAGIGRVPLWCLVSLLYAGLLSEACACRRGAAVCMRGARRSSRRALPAAPYKRFVPSSQGLNLTNCARRVCSLTFGVLLRCRSFSAPADILVTL